MIYAEKKTRGYGGKEVWHLSIVNIWQANKEYCSENEQLPTNKDVQELNNDVQNLNKDTESCSENEHSCSKFGDRRRVQEEEQLKEEDKDKKIKVKREKAHIHSSQKPPSKQEGTNQETSKPYQYSPLARACLDTYNHMCDCPLIPEEEQTNASHFEKLAIRLTLSEGNAGLRDIQLVYSYMGADKFWKDRRNPKSFAEKFRDFLESAREEYEVEQYVNPAWLPSVEYADVFRCILPYWQNKYFAMNEIERKALLDQALAEQKRQTLANKV